LKTYILISWKNLKEMDKFLDAYDMPKLKQEDINQPHRFITSNETETVMEFPHKEKPRTG
jgi:hypothetical protein